MTKKEEINLRNEIIRLSFERDKYKGWYEIKCEEAELLMNWKNRLEGHLEESRQINMKLNDLLFKNKG